jgi:hypothetical protein
MTAESHRGKTNPALPTLLPPGHIETAAESHRAFFLCDPCALSVVLCRQAGMDKFKSDTCLSGRQGYRMRHTGLTRRFMSFEDIPTLVPIVIPKKRGSTIK